jgi:hypothetical protein
VLSIVAESYDILGINHEIGDLSEWDSETVTGTNDVVIESSAPLHGSYSAKSTFDGTNYECYLCKNFPDTLAEFYIRIYFKLNSAFSFSSGYFVPLTVEDSGGNAIVRLRSSSGSLELNRFYYRTDAGDLYVTPSAFTFLVDTLYYVEYYFKQSSGANDGIAELKINGTTYAQVTGIDNDTITGYRVCAGNRSTAIPTSDSVIIFDDLIVNNVSGWPGAYSDGGSIIPILTANRRRIIS